MYDSDSLPRIKVVGVGGAGENTINRLDNLGLNGAELIAVDYDKQHLDIIHADKKVLTKLPPVRGLVCGSCHPELGEQSAEMAIKEIKDLFPGTDLVFIVAGMGGNMGSGASPVIARAAKDQGATAICFAVMPYKIERPRLAMAEENLAGLLNEADAVVALDLNKMIDFVPDLPLDQGLSVMDQIIAETIKGLVETINQPSLINFELCDVKAITGTGSRAMMMVGILPGDKRVNIVDEVLKHPLHDGDHSKVTGVLVHVTGGPDMAPGEAEDVALSIRDRLDPRTNVIWGAKAVNGYEDKIKVVAIPISQGVSI